MNHKQLFKRRMLAIKASMEGWENISSRGECASFYLIPSGIGYFEFLIGPMVIAG